MPLVNKPDTKPDTKKNIASIYAVFTIYTRRFKSCYLHQEKKSHEYWKTQCLCGFSLFSNGNLAYFLQVKIP